MPKSSFQDVVPPEKRSIRKIPLPERKAQAVEQMENEYRRPDRSRYYDEPADNFAPLKVAESRSAGSAGEEHAERVPSSPDFYARPEGRAPAGKKGRGAGRRILGVLALVAAIAVAGAVVFGGETRASVLLTPKGQSVSINSQFAASKTAAEGGLQFETMAISKDGRLAVAAAGEERADTKASGTIVVYNNYSAAPQTLVANTRFQTPEGLIYRIQSQISVPGRKAQGGSTVPGSLEVAVVADQAGESYNVGLTDFTIPGFKGDPRFSAVYARSKTPMQGGFSGMVKKVSPADEQSGREKIKAELETALVDQAKQDIPEGYVLLPGAFAVEYQNLPNASTATGAELQTRGTLKGILFKEADLARAIAAKVVESPENPVSGIAGAANLAFVPRSTSTAAWDADTVVFNLQGPVTLVAGVDAQAIKAELAGKPRDSLEAVLAAFPSVESAQAAVKPFWKRSFPAAEALDVAVASLEPAGQ